MARTFLLLSLLAGALLFAGCRPARPVSAIASTVPSATTAPKNTRTQLPVLEPPATSEGAMRSRPPLPPATATSTPTITPIPTPIPWDGYPAPTTAASTAIPPPFSLNPLPPEIFSVALLGSDSEAAYAGRTDSILIALINRETGAASLVSIPRDLYVYIPGWTMERINVAYSLGGFDLLALTLEYNLGLRPDYWALVRFEDFVRFVNDLGGIDVPVSHPLPDDCGGIPSGIFHMSGEAALCYVRERQTSSDVDRSRRQQEVLSVILDRVWSLDGLRQLPEWYDRYQGSIESNLWLYDLIELIPAALKFQDAGLGTYQIGWDQVTPWQEPESGAMVLLPKREEVSYIIQNAVNAVRVPIPTSPALETRIAVLTATVTPLPTETQAPAIEPAVLPSETSTETPEPNDD